MKRLTWNSGKNTKLKFERGVSFEMVLDCLARGAYRVGPTTSKSHRSQQAFFVRLNGRAWVVPFDENETRVLLKTIMEDK
jgi:hypothetical protein